MQLLSFPVAVDGGDADVEIEVSEKDVKKLMRYAEDDAYDSPEDVEELESICEKLRKRIFKALCEQVEDYEDMDMDDLDFSFGFPELSD